MKQKGQLIRIDKPKNPFGGSTHGWQVRLPTGQPRKYKSRLFSDNPCGGPEQARQEAERYLAENQAQIKYAPPANAPYFERPPSHNTSGVVGVCRTHQYNGQGQYQEYWGAFVPVGPDGRRHYTKKFYISDECDEEEALRLAVEFRAMWEEAADQGEAAIRKFFEEYESGWL